MCARSRRARDILRITCHGPLIGRAGTCDHQRLKILAYLTAAIACHSQPSASRLAPDRPLAVLPGNAIGYRPTPTAERLASEECECPAAVAGRTNGCIRD